ncbi:endothelin-converting enzyme 2-like [Amblyomma americanum]
MDLIPSSTKSETSQKNSKLRKRSNQSPNRRSKKTAGERSPPDITDTLESTVKPPSPESRSKSPPKSPRTQRADSPRAQHQADVDGELGTEKANPMKPGPASRAVTTTKSTEPEPASAPPLSATPKGSTGPVSVAKRKKECVPAGDVNTGQATAETTALAETSLRLSGKSSPARAQPAAPATVMATEPMPSDASGIVISSKKSSTTISSGHRQSRVSGTSAGSLAIPRKRSASDGFPIVLLSACFCILLVVVILVVVLLIVVLRLWPHPEQNATEEQYCQTQDCRQHAQLITAMVNPKADPCEDLNAFACSRWRPVGGSYDNYGAALDSLAFHDWFDGFYSSLVEGSNHLFAGAKPLAMFEACVQNSTNGSEEGKRMLRGFMSKLRIPWPDEPSADVDPLGVLIDLSYRWHLGLWFDLEPLRLPSKSPAFDEGTPSDGHTGSNSSRRHLFMKMGQFVGFWSVHHSEILHEHSYIDYWDTFYAAFGAGLPKRSDAYVKHVSTVEAAVFEELLGVVNNENKEPAQFELGDIGVRTPRLPASRWIEQLSANTAPVKEATNSSERADGFAPADTLTVTDMALLIVVDRLFAVHNATVLLRHLSWFFIQVFAALADRDLLAAKYADKAKAAERRHVFCATEVEDAYGPLVPALYVFPRFTSRIRRLVDDVFSNVCEAARDKVSSLVWADKATRQVALKKLHKMRTVLWPPEFILSNERLNELYANFAASITTNTSLFIEHWVDAQKSLRVLYDVPGFRKDPDMPPNYVLPYFDYDYLQNRVLISVAALHGVLKAVQATPAVLYGGLGFSFARQLLRALDSGGLKIDPEGNVLPDTWASPQWKEAAQKRQVFPGRCLST